MKIKKTLKKLASVVMVATLLVLTMPVGVLAAPLAPTSLAATVATGPVVNLSWTDTSTDEVAFKLMRAVTPSTTFAQVGLDLPPSNPASNTGSTMSVTDTTVVAGVTYSYQVVARDLAGALSPPSNTVTITATLPAAPSALTLTQQAGPPQTVTLSWTDNSNNEIGFRIERADNAGFTLNKVENVRTANVIAAPVTFVDADIIPGATYFYRVSALGMGGVSAATTPATITVNAAAGLLAGAPVPIAGFPAPNGFPLYYQDTLGNKVRLLPLGGVLFGDPPIDGNAYSQTLGFGSEEFYWTAIMDIAAGGVEGSIEFAIEAIFGSPGGSAVPTTEAVMARTRVKLNVPLAGDYTIQTPYGTRTFTGVQVLPGEFDINDTEDIGANPRIFSGANSPIQPQDPALNPRPVNVFLKPVTPPLNPDLYGDGVAEGPVTGGAGGTTITITGPGVNISKSLWVIAGRNLAAPVVPSFTKSFSAPASFAFASTSTGTPTSFLWDFGDGGSSILADPVHTYTTAGNFLVKLTVANAGGTASASQMVSIFSAPSAAFTTAGGATPFTINFTSPTAGNPTGWFWDFGDSITSTLQNPTHVYTTAGAFTVTLSVFNPAGTATASQQLVVGPPVVPTNVTAVVASATQINVSWTDNALNETGFRLDRAENNLFTGATLLTRNITTPSTGAGLTVTFNDTTNITTNKIFFYRVFAVNATNSSEASATAQAQVGGPPTGQPVLTATLLSSTQIKLDWTDPNTNEDFYHLHRSPNINFAPLTDIVRPTDTITFTDDVAAGQTFFYFIHAMNALGESPNSNIVQISTTVPAAPASLTAVVASTTSVTLNWTAATSASGYKVERSIGAGTGTFTLLEAGTLGNVLTFSDTTVTAGNVYNYRVFATNVIGSSATASPTATVDMTAPPAPVLNAAVANASGTISLSWNNVTNEQGYRVQRALGTGTLAQIAEVGANVVTFTDTAAAPETSYQYQVTAFNGMGGSNSNVVSVTSATPTAPPAAPSGLTATATAFNNVNLSWTDNALNEAGFRIERSTDNAIFTLLAGIPGVNVTTLADASVAPSTTYFYRVFAFNSSGNSTAAAASSVTTPAAPVAPSGGGGGGGGGAGPALVSLTGITGGDLTIGITTGVTLNSALLTTSDGKATISIAAGTVMNNASGNALTNIIVAPATPPSPPPQGAVVINYDFGPDGATFSPSLVINLIYADSDIPAGANEADLYAAYWDGAKWVKLVSTVNIATNTITAQVLHFTNIAVLSTAPPPPLPAPAPAPELTITSPSAGATLDSGNVQVSVNVSNFELVAPGGANAAGKGHLHYYLDVDIPTTPGQPTFSAPGTYKASPNTTVTWENLSSGNHTLGVQLVNSDHTPLSPPVTATVTAPVIEPAPVAAPAPVTAPAPAPELTITSPSDGATLDSGNVQVSVQTSNFNIVAPGGANAAGQGHIHYYLDVPIPTEAGKPAVSAAGTYKATPGTTVTWENLSLGTHTLGVQLVNNNHTPLSSPVTASVTVTVRQVAAPPVTEQPTTPAPAAPAPAAAFNWWWVIGAVIIVAAIAIIISLMTRRKQA